MANCQLCNEPVEEPDQPEGAELCNSCAAYLDARFGGIGNAISDLALADPNAIPDNDD